MAYNIEFFEAGEQDLDDASAWYVSESLATASRFVDAYLVLLDRLAENPFQFPNALGEVHKARFPKPFPFNNYFIVISDTVFVIAVFHDKRNPVEWQGRV